ncbi:GIY-YIG nuclease family protein [Halobacillus rhizosphaerae]|uniref:GIY-YIG nuclease family protein n=1 Tax=Halobacillus rhizosphaerae TaxID=3064889 RepID=UPI00398A6481
MGEYKYNNLPIMPSIIEILIIELFNGKTLKRDEIVNEVLDYHISNGGASPEVKDFPRSVKKALERMNVKGWATNKSYGYWEIKKEDSPINEEIVEDEEEDTKEDEKIPIKKIYGSGNSSVYLYYFDTYKNFALLKGHSTWPCKIGRTDRDVLIRILSQGSTALPEMPTIEYIIKTEDAPLLETMLHSVLEIKGNNIEDSPGSEWFDTNPEEVIEIVEFANKNLLDY